MFVCKVVEVGRCSSFLVPLPAAWSHPPHVRRLTTVKAHKTAVTAKERDISAREIALAEREARVTALVAEKDAEIL
ncbi:hypothetical protein PAXINDRAFT_168149 [Paxillus involutus ATCC 200175]|nr:hypothetical protein PAXINDRAFT_168149 [Paxillus involutus ATCC 200175]